MAVELAACTFDGCQKPRAKRGYCGAHYQQWRKTGSVRPLTYDRSRPKVCSECGVTDWPDNGKRRQCSARCQQLASRARRGEMVLRTVPCIACGVTVHVGAVVGERKRRSDRRYCQPCRRLRGIRLVGSGVVTIEQVRAMGDTCAICRTHIDFDATQKSLRPSIDHVIPRALGGTDAVDNLQLTHFGCNQRKHLRASADDFGREDRQRLYRSRAWRRFAHQVRIEEPSCGCGAPSTCVDHITAIADGGDPWDRRNVAAMCRRCHNRKSQAEYRHRERVALGRS